MTKEKIRNLKSQLTIKIGYAYQWARLNFHGISDCSLLTDSHQNLKIHN